MIQFVNYYIYCYKPILKQIKLKEPFIGGHHLRRYKINKRAIIQNLHLT